MSKLILLSGKSRSGKDTVADFLLENYDYHRIGFADALKNGVHEMFGFTREQLYGDAKLDPDDYWSEVFGKEITPVSILQIVGTDLFRKQLHSDIWAYATYRVIEDNPDRNWIIPDARFPNEVRIGIEEFGAEVYRIERPLEDRGNTGRDPNHISETALDDYDEWTDVIVNDGTLQELFMEAENKILGIKHDQINAFTGKPYETKA